MIGVYKHMHIKIIAICGLIATVCLLAPFKAFPGPYYLPEVSESDSLPLVLPGNKADLVDSRLRNEAVTRFAALQLPVSLTGWESYKKELRSEIIRKTGAVIDHKLPLDIRETVVLQMPGYRIRNIYFQTRPGVYATANLFIPEGKGPFPGIVVMSGHSPNGRLYEPYQAVGHSLAKNGYVALSIDPWGAGERTTKHGTFEYHGANLGSSLMNIGESLMGMHISDNIRGVDLLCSLPYVDRNNIGATGTSGGGNQTMWLAALDDRVKAAIPVTSVGTFESYVMRVNCVCETLVDGLTFTEEAGVLALARAVMPINAIKDNPTFTADEMMRSHNNAKPVFDLCGSGDNISYRIFDLRHGYLPEYRQAMLGWFDLKLKGKGDGTAKEELPFDLVPTEKIMTFSSGKRDIRVLSTEEYCRKRGNELRMDYLGKKAFLSKKKKEELNDILRINGRSELEKVHEYAEMNGWKRYALETSDGKLIPVLYRAPQNASAGYTVLVDPKGKNNLSLEYIERIKQKGEGVVILDLTGAGETETEKSRFKDFVYHNLSRSLLWLGKTLMGEWVKEIDLVTSFLRSDFNAQKITLDGSREAGLACLFLGALKENIHEIILRDAPVSYLFDNREGVDFFSSAVYLPGFLNWGDLSLAAALSGANIRFVRPLTMSGQTLNGKALDAYKAEFGKARKISRQNGQTSFIETPEYSSTVVPKPQGGPG